PAGRPVGGRLEGEERPVDRVPPFALVRAPRGPIGPVPDRALERVPRIDPRRRRLERTVPGHRERDPIAGGDTEVRRDVARDDVERGVGPKIHRVRPRDRRDAPPSLTEPRDGEPVVEAQEQRSEERRVGEEWWSGGKR